MRHRVSPLLAPDITSGAFNRYGTGSPGPRLAIGVLRGGVRCDISQLLRQSSFLAAYRPLRRRPIRRQVGRASCCGLSWRARHSSQFSRSKRILVEHQGYPASRRYRSTSLTSWATAASPRKCWSSWRSRLRRLARHRACRAASPASSPRDRRFRIRASNPSSIGTKLFR